MLVLLSLGCNQPCETAVPTTSTIVEIFQRLDQEQCLHREDLTLLKEQVEELHEKTTLHCDEVWRKSSIDGLLFDGPIFLIF